jgi:agmatinase
MVYPRFSGIRTFMRLPQITDLTGVDFAIVGIPFDTGGTYRVGARFGPEAIRSASVLLRPYHPEHEIAIFDICSGIDFGDLPVVPGYLPQSHEKIRAEAAKLFEASVTPMFVGGDHSVTLPLLRAAHAVFGPVALVHFDAHGDVWEGYFGGLDTHGTPFRRAVEEGLIDLSRSIQIGLRGSVYARDDIQVSRDLGFEVVTASELHQRGVASVLQLIRDRVGIGKT